MATKKPHHEKDLRAGDLAKAIAGRAIAAALVP